MKKVANGEKKRKRGADRKIMAEIVTTNIVARRPPEDGPTGTPTAHAKIAKSTQSPIFPCNP